MSLAVRVIPCLDVDAGRVVKGIRFSEMRDVGDPVESAVVYEEQGADELVLLDVSATPEGRENNLATVAAVREVLSIPLTVGGGVRSVGDARSLLEAGADKVGVNTAAVERPALIEEISRRFGSQVLVLSVDARRVRPGDPPTPSGFEVTTHGGRRGTGRDAVAWVRHAAEAGAGEVLLNSIDTDGTKSGFDLDLIEAVRAAVDVPLIASGGAGNAEHFVEAVRAGADAVLAASVFHYGWMRIGEVKDALRAAGLEVR